MKRGTNPAEIVYVAAALASWDAHVEGRLSPETEKAVALMFSLQHDNGVWYSVDTWPPFESSAYQLATVAAMAVGMAPGWLEKSKSAEEEEGVGRLREYFRGAEPPHDYARVALLWASQHLPGLMDAAAKDQTVEMILSHQRPDGGGRFGHSRNPSSGAAAIGPGVSGPRRTSVNRRATGIRPAWP